MLIYGSEKIKILQGHFFIYQEFALTIKTPSLLFCHKQKGDGFEERNNDGGGG